VVGLRATPGLVPMARKEMAWSPLWTEGPMARNVADLALMLQAIVGSDPRDPLSGFARGEDFAGLAPVDLKGCKIAVSEDLGFAPISRQVRGLFRQRTEVLAGAVACDETAPSMSGADRCFEVLRAVGFLGRLRELWERHPEQVGPNVTANVKLGLTFSAADVAEASARQTRLYHRMLDFMADYDALICPAASVQPFDKELLYPEEIDGRKLDTYISWIAITYGLTLAGHPVLVLPCGLDEEGLPFGVQVVGRRGRDAELLRLGLALEAVFAASEATRTKPPALDQLAG
jgi:Asp-tRNA(Asn)/Glu-tRNA(Gln) amidotransferase A subunit family amidase